MTDPMIMAMLAQQKKYDPYLAAMGQGAGSMQNLDNVYANTAEQQGGNSAGLAPVQNIGGLLGIGGATNIGAGYSGGGAEPTYDQKLEAAKARQDAMYVGKDGKTYSRTRSLR